MKLKLDENLGRLCAELFRQAGLEVMTVPGQDLCSTADRDLIALCRAEGKTLVTLDLDFANPLLFKPSRYAGIAVLRLPARAAPAHLTDAVRTLISGLPLLAAR